MAWNGLENEGCGAMGEMLMANCGLKLLDLGHTRMGGEACLLLAEGLKVCAVAAAVYEVVACKVVMLPSANKAV